MSYSEETMNAISAALAGGPLASTGADRAGDPSGESQAVSKPFPRATIVKRSELGNDWTAESHLVQDDEVSEGSNNDS